MDDKLVLEKFLLGNEDLEKIESFVSELSRLGCVRNPTIINHQTYLIN